MAEYLLQTNKMLSIAEKQEMFAVKNRMKNISANYPKPNEEYFCECGMKEDMSHIYHCEILNKGYCPGLEYDRLYIGTLSEQIQIFRHFEINYKRREKVKCESKNLLPRDPPEIHCTQSSIVISASADGGPRSRVRARGTLCSAPHRH